MSIEASASVASGTLVNLMQICQPLEKERRIDEVLSHYQQWLLSNANAPMAHIAWYEFGRILNQNQQLHRSVNAFRASLEQKADFLEAHMALGSTLEAHGEIDEALKTWEGMLEFKGDHTAPLNNIGRVYDATHRLEDAEVALTKSIKINAAQPDVLTTLLYLRQRMCAWPITPKEVKIPKAKLPDSVGPLSSLALFNNPIENLKSATNFIKLKGFNKKSDFIKAGDDKSVAGRKIKVGFLSADFRMHATSFFFQSLLIELNRDEFEIFALDITVTKELFGSTREDLLKLADHSVQLQKLNDDDAVKHIRSLNLDILVDMAGLTAGARPNIVARRCAPLQVSYLGFIGSSGIAAVDYIITTKDLFVKEYAAGYSEQPLYLPDMYIPIDQAIEVSNIPSLTREQCGLPENGFVYCALLNSYKITPDVFDTWLSIIGRVPGSVLWLVLENEAVRRNLTQYALDKGIEQSRLIFSQRIQPSLYRDYLKQADIFLDTSPYGNGATAREAILARLPILTCPGNTMMSRLTAHLMKRLGMNDFIVDDLAQYQEFAVHLGNSPELVAQYKQKMFDASQSSALFDTKVFAKQFGDTLLSICK